jgi:hypothetical protein
MPHTQSFDFGIEFAGALPVLRGLPIAAAVALQW